MARRARREDGSVSAGLVQALLGCEWGRRVSSDDDLAPCDAQATSMVCLHEGDGQITLKLCDRHRAIVDSESTPRATA